MLLVSNGVEKRNKNIRVRSYYCILYSISGTIKLENKQNENKSGLPITMAALMSHSIVNVEYSGLFFYFLKHFNEDSPYPKRTTQ